MKLRHGGILLGALFSVGVLSQALADDKVVIGYAYDKLVPIYGPVYLMIKYEGRSR